LQLFLAGIVGRGRWSVIVDIDEEEGLIYRSGFCSVEKIIRIELIGTSQNMARAGCFT
jgi:hypothetical protein